MGLGKRGNLQWGGFHFCEEARWSVEKLAPRNFLISNGSGYTPSLQGRGKLPVFLRFFLSRKKNRRQRKKDRGFSKGRNSSSRRKLVFRRLEPLGKNRDSVR